VIIPTSSPVIYALKPETIERRGIKERGKKGQEREREKKVLE